MADNWSKNGLLYRRNSLTYPAGRAPAIDLSHPASQGLQLSAVATAGNMISLTQGMIGTIVGAPSYALDSSIGPSFVTSGATNCSARFAGHPAAQHDSATIAGIVKLSALAPTGALFMNSGVVAGYVLYFATGTNDLELAYAGQGTSLSGLPLVANVPYFYIVSAKASTVTNFLIKRLDTGTISTVAQTAFATPSISDGTYTVGDDNSNDVFAGKTSTVMFATNYMTVPEMLAWAADPWSFWYPRQSLNIVSLAAAASTSNFVVFSAPYDDNRTITQMIGY